MLSELRTGQIATSDGAISTGRASKDGSLIVGAGMGDYQELAYRGRVFFGTNQGPGAITTTVALAATYTGLCVSNPAGSNKNLVLLQASVAVVGAPAALAVVGLMGGYAQAGVVTHTTPLIPLSSFMNTTIATGVAKVDASCALPGTPTLILPLGVTPITGATAQVINPTVNLALYDLKGSIILPPGAYAAIYTSTVLTILAGFTWAEVDA